MKNIIKYLLVYIVLNLSNGFAIFGQNADWSAYYFEETLVDTLYSIRGDDQVIFDEQISFPAFGYYDRTFQNGFRLPKVYNDTEKNNSTWRKKLNQSIKTESDITQVYYKVSVQDVNSMVISLHDSLTDNWLVYKTNFDYSGFQFPGTISLSEFNLFSENQPIKDGLTKTILAIDEINIESVGSKEGKLIVDYFLIGNEKSIRKEVIHPFFDDLLGFNHTLEEMKVDYVNPVIHTPSSDHIYGKIDGRVYLETLDWNLEKEKGQIVGLLSKCIEEYPFYIERNIKKSETKLSFDILINEIKNDEYCLFINKLSDFIKVRFNDPHFKISVSKDCRKDNTVFKSGPIRFVEINNDFKIAAILDTIYANSSLGDNLIMIDEFQVEKIKDSKDIQSLLKKTSNDSTLLLLENSDNELYNLVMYYDRPPTIPRDFKIPKHGDFKLFDNNSISYLKLNSWGLDVHTRMVNVWDKIVDSDTFVLDLRGNGGGEQIATLRMHSLFINSPQRFTSFEDGSTLITEPNSKLFFPDKQLLILLIDARTACGSESFISAINDRPNTIIVGDEKTYGALSSRYDINFPSNTTIAVNCINPKDKLSEKIENLGIAPDVKVQLKNVSDLVPYNDKVLLQALKISRQTHANANYKNVGELRSQEYE
ncbi:S41 family peptidase [Maribacter flavus]|uniref:Tail specific protease domain-containing protein n=1 Tax=Maribacter flavus TaxID=1658664 RepID=A0A5B2TQG6_9FLAO|nr:S41 family peptidase [Maribacter flavus]KAA2215790.1 hypothetical protein F0361_16475 [Maribacter flavus]